MAPRVLIVSSKRWPIPARIGLALGRAGFLVAALSPRSSFVSCTRSIKRLYFYGLGRRTSSIAAAIEDWCPDILICTDDPSVEDLHNLYAKAAKAPKSDRTIRLLKLVEKSLGNPNSFELTEKKSSLLRLACSLGIRCPSTTYISNKDVEASPDSISFPVLVKADGGWGGKFVRIARNMKEARKTVCEFQLPAHWPTLVRQFLSNVVTPSIVRSFRRNPAEVGFQEFIRGTPANRAVVCRDGRVLAGVSLRAHKTAYTFGPASLVEIIDSSEMSAAVATLVENLGLSGLIGFDFVLDDADRAWFIEMNPRVTPACYLRCGPDLPAALFAEMTGRPVPSGDVSRTGTLLALFPQGINHAGCAAEKRNEDVPWEDPELVLALLHSVLRGGMLKRLGMKRRNRQNSSA